MRMLNRVITFLMLAIGCCANACADDLNSGNTAWLLTATALVLFMTLPGLALFYGGLVRSKNALSVLKTPSTMKVLSVLKALSVPKALSVLKVLSVLKALSALNALSILEALSVLETLSVLEALCSFIGTRNLSRKRLFSFIGNQN